MQAVNEREFEGYNGELKVAYMATCVELVTIAPFEPGRDHPGSVALSPNGKTLASY